MWKMTRDSKSACTELVEQWPERSFMGLNHVTSCPKDSKAVSHKLILADT